MIEQVETTEQAKARGATSVSSEYSLFFFLLLLVLKALMLHNMLLPLLTLNAWFQIIQRKLVQVVTPSTNIDGNIGPDAVHLLSIKEVLSYLLLSAKSFTFVY